MALPVTAGFPKARPSTATLGGSVNPLACITSRHGRAEQFVRSTRGLKRRAPPHCGPFAPTMAAPDCANLPQLASPADSWSVYVHRIRAFVPLSGLNTEPVPVPGSSVITLVRPYIILVVSVGNGVFLSCSDRDGTAGSNLFIQEEPPTAEQVDAFLRRVMASPRAMSSDAGATAGPAPGRPKRVFVAHTASARTLAGQKAAWPAADDTCPYVLPLRQLLAPLECTVQFAPVPAHLLNEVVRGQIDPAFASDDGNNLCSMPGLSDVVDGWTPAFGASLFGATADFLRSGAYHTLPADAPVRITYRLSLNASSTSTDVKQGALSARVNAFLVRTGTAPPVGDDGDAGEAEEESSFGISIFSSADAAYAAIAAASVADGTADVSVVPRSGQAVTFVMQASAPCADVDDAETHGWALVNTAGVTVAAADVAAACIHVDESSGNATASIPVLFPLFISARVVGDDGIMPPAAGGDGDSTQVELSRPSIMELQAFEVGLRALADLAAEAAAPGLTAAAAAGESLSAKVTSFAAKGEPEELLLEVCPLTVTPALTKSAADATYL
jgi:hypothetical protein